jgi:hypothetical protein
MQILESVTVSVAKNIGHRINLEQVNSKHTSSTLEHYIVESFSVRRLEWIWCGKTIIQSFTGHRFCRF